jgi:hypothetical protein
MGRPSIKTPELIEAICERLETGEPLTVICAAKHMPAPRTVREWQENDPVVSAAIARAREVGFDAIAIKALSIADERDEDPASRRVMVETRLKLLAKWDPKRYGDKLGIGQAEGLEPVAVRHIERRIVDNATD